MNEATAQPSEQNICDSEVLTSRDDVTKNPPRYLILNVTYQAEPTTDNSRSVRKETSFKERKLQKLNDRKTRRNEKVEAREKELMLTKEEHGIFQCSFQNRVGALCCKEFHKKEQRDEHALKQDPNCHTFRSISSSTAVIQRYLDPLNASKICFGVGSHVNTNDAVRDKSPGVNDQSAQFYYHEGIGNFWFKCGCYNKRSDKGHRHSIALLMDFERMFQIGKQDKSKKYNDSKAYEELAAMTVEIDGNKRLKYSYDPNNKNGPVPSKQKIKSWFSTRSGTNGKPPNLSPTVEAMKEMAAEQGLPKTYKLACIEVLKLHTELNPGTEFPTAKEIRTLQGAKSAIERRESLLPINAETTEKIKPTEKVIFELMLKFYAELNR